VQILVSSVDYQVSLTDKILTVAALRRRRAACEALGRSASEGKRAFRIRMVSVALFYLESNVKFLSHFFQVRFQFLHGFQKIRPLLGD